MEYTNSDWKKLSEELADKCVRSEDDFMPDPFKSPKLQRQIAVKELAKMMEMPAFFSYVDQGIEAIAEKMGNLPEEEQEKIFNLIDYLEEAFESIHDTNAFVNNKGVIDISNGLGLSPETLLPLENLGMECLANSEWPAEVGIFSVLALLNTTEPRYLFLRALGFYFTHAWEEGLNNIEAAIAMNPFQPEYFILAASLSLTKDPKKAKEYFDEALMQFKHNPSELSAFWQERYDELKMQLQG